MKFNKEEINWIERTADIETSILFNRFNTILMVYEDATEKQKILLDKQIDELITTYTFLKVLRSKIENGDKNE